LDEIKFTRKAGLSMLLMAKLASLGIFGEILIIWVDISFKFEIIASNSLSLFGGLISSNADTFAL